MDEKNGFFDNLTRRSFFSKAALMAAVTLGGLVSVSKGIGWGEKADATEPGKGVPMKGDQVKALIFDVFGTVVDWRSSVIREGERLGAEKGWKLDWGTFADEWRFDGYIAGTRKVVAGELPWTTADRLHRLQLDRMLETRGLASQLTEAEKDHFNKVWHRLAPWPESVEGLTRLRRKYIIAPFSNGNFALLTNMAKAVGLPWDCILSAELNRLYKPDLRTYTMATDLLGLEPGQVMMVAAHFQDLRAARSVGLRTGFVYRPTEFGGVREADRDTTGEWDVSASSFIELAEKMGA